MRLGQVVLVTTFALVAINRGVVAADNDKADSNTANTRNLLSFEDTPPDKGEGSRKSPELSPNEEERRGAVGIGRGGGSPTYSPAPTEESMPDCNSVSDTEEDKSLWEKFKAWWNDPGYC